MAIKEVRTKILLSLLLLTDLEPKKIVFDKNVCYIFDLIANKKLQQTLSILVNEGKIHTESNKDGEHEYLLTQNGYGDLVLEFPLFRFMKEPWDRKWRILSYEIPESKRELRDKLRRKVAGWGLGPWHRSFWLTPHPIIEPLRELISKKEEEKYIQAFEADHAYGNKEILIEKVWGLTKLEATYKSLFKKWHEILSEQHEKNDKLKKIINKYVDVLKIDPGLPSELTGDQWIGHEGFKIFKEIRQILLTNK